MTNRLSEEFIERVKGLLNEHKGMRSLNDYLKGIIGISDFFGSISDLEEFKEFLNTVNEFKQSERDFGDFQTPTNLTERICRYLFDRGFQPSVIIEPTCGKGNFVVSAIKQFPSIKYVYCVDSQSKYEWFFKLNMLKLAFEDKLNLDIEFHRDSIFTHVFSERFTHFLDNNDGKILILGNPPWVTSSELSSLNSKNLPSKFNIKKHKGIDAITGKSNFDIAEYIILRMVKCFSHRQGKIAMLCKTSVVKNIIKDMEKLSLRTANNHELLIDGKKEFNISASAALFLADLGLKAETFCTVSSFYDSESVCKRFGYVGSNFVSDVDLYKKYKYIDGKSSFLWRQGVKHDAIKVMVLKIDANGKLSSGVQRNIDVEKELIYPFLKGSQLKKPVTTETLSRIIITQSSPSEDTNNIAFRYPKLWSYLISHSNILDNRKSVIYKKRPKFSIFGIGDYSFKPYKIAVSGFYKEPKFSLVLPINKKPTMLDDTCYFLYFEKFKTAFFTWVLLNIDDVKQFLFSIVFKDSKRPYTKEVLMRIDFSKLVNKTSFDTLCTTYEENLQKYMDYKFTEQDFIEYKLDNAFISERKFGQQ